MRRSRAPRKLEEVIVTAQKRDEKLRDVPSSVSVISGARIESTGATSLAEYASYVPGLVVNSGGTPGQASIVLRGISTGGDGISGALVGTYLNDSPVGASTRNARPAAFALDLLPYDLDRIEVLRGPQGTLYGASTMAGLLKYVLRDADPNRTEVRVGGSMESTQSTNEPTYGVRGAVNVPLIDGVLGIRASGFYQDNAGWIDNVGLGVHNENSSTQQGGRVAALWQPTDDITIKATAMFQDIEADGNAVVQLDRDTFLPVVNRYTRSTSLREPYEQTLRFYSVTANWDAGPVEFTSATSWSSSRNTAIGDQSLIYPPLFGLFDPTAPAAGLSDFLLDIDLEKFTQEFRVASPTGSDFEWLLGAFYTDEDILNIQHLGAYTTAGAPIASLTPFAHVSFRTATKKRPHSPTLLTSSASCSTCLAACASAITSKPSARS